MTYPGFSFPFVRCLLAVATVFPLALAACGDDASGGASCLVEGEIHQPGDSFPSPDGCNTCTCTEEGDVACTLMACGCSYGGSFHAVGESFSAEDGCNTCTCLDDGTVACTDMACVATCEYMGATYNVGESFPAGDGCNTCGCLDDGTVACTLIACPACVYVGETYQPGETFPSIDGCNTCSCLADGTVSCTEIACPCDPQNEWWREYTSTDSEECLLLDFACSTNTLRFDNACGCGCEQDASCPPSFDCMPPAQCDVEAIQERCPYSEIAF